MNPNAGGTECALFVHYRFFIARQSTPAFTKPFLATYAGVSTVAVQLAATLRVEGLFPVPTRNWFYP